eukprot:CAMPEP_0118643700 /NCGR_PEP_ID=MMETSP0785-20121206/6532_1 /TAXON_ID=91992 /ORGANISM="Bolidomonas pacifica, Strain CCMP 1866" /LENGTH=556 /DNA_ID=CAMNT_0006535383 /DNA_START=345 /DNA_END=2015 /DNA_ORIENTATION=+
MTQSLTILADSLVQKEDNITGVVGFDVNTPGRIRMTLLLESNISVLLSLMQFYQDHRLSLSCTFPSHPKNVPTSSKTHLYTGLSIRLPPHLNHLRLSSSPDIRTTQPSSAQFAQPDNYRRLRTIASHNNKFVFTVHDPSTNRYHIMKETTLRAKKSLDHAMGEFNVVDMLHQSAPQPQGLYGIINTPRCFIENVRVTLIYDMHVCDLHDMLNVYTSYTKCDGFPEEMAIIWIAQLLYVVNQMIQRNVVHRDVKPENILLDKDCNVVLTDFEVAKIVPEGEQPFSKIHKIVGTSIYIPPEVGTKQFQDSAKYDMWSLGVVAWELIHIAHPWTTKIGLSKPPRMSDLCFNFIKNIVCEHSERFTIQQAMSHPLFSHVDFNDPETLFSTKETKRKRKELQTVLEIFNKVIEAQQEKASSDNAISPIAAETTAPTAPTASPPPLSDRRECNEEIRRKLIELECWKDRQKLIPTPEKRKQLPDQQPEVIRLHKKNTDIRRVPQTPPSTPTRYVSRRTTLPKHCRTTSTQPRYATTKKVEKELMEWDSEFMCDKEYNLNCKV